MPSQRRMLMWFGAAAGVIVVVGLVIVLVLTLAGTFGGERALGGNGQEAPPEDYAPPLARLCPPPSEAPAPENLQPPAVPPGPRTVDHDAGISYAQYGDPWQPWQDNWTAGELEVQYRVGQHFITEVYPGGTYHASILSGSVPATVNDGMQLDLECAGKQVVADVRVSYYPQPNEMETIRSELTTLGGRPAWVSVFRLYFNEPGLTATDELVAVATIDVGSPEAAVLYVSIPGTHREFDWVVEDVLASVRPL